MGKYAINEEFLQDIETLEMIIKNNIAGLFGGMHQSKSFGSSCEFADYRDYLPGDDISKIDWNQYARSERLYLKQYLDERRLHTRIYIDASRSMDFNTKKATKALQIAAAFAYLSVVSMDKVSIYCVHDNMITDVAVNMVGKEQFYANISKINDIEFTGEFKFSEAIRPTTVGYGDGLSIVISDFLTDEDYKNGIDYLVSKKRDVLCVQMLSSEELNPSVRGKVHFYDSENLDDEYRKNINKDVMKAYRKALSFIQEDLENFCSSRGARYLMVPDNSKMNDVFISMLPMKGVLK